MDNVRKHMIISGRVQGVGFRYRAYYSARNNNLTGWIRNLDNGDVELEVQGKSNFIDFFLSQIENGTFIYIENIFSENIDVIVEREFKIL